MVLLIRNEDNETVATLVQELAASRGLQVVEEGAGAHGVTFSEDAEFVRVDGLADLALMDAAGWARHLSLECETEALSFEEKTGERCVHIQVFDDGESDEEFAVAIDANGRMHAPELAELVDDAASKRALVEGVTADTPDASCEALVRCFTEASVGSQSLRVAFADTYEPKLVAEALAGGALKGRVGQAVAPEHGNVFCVRSSSREPVHGIALDFGGEAFALMRVGTIHVWVRERDAEEPTHYRIDVPDASPVGLSLQFPNAHLDAVAETMHADSTDMMVAMERWVGAAHAQLNNTLLVHVSGFGLRAGEGALELVASSLTGACKAGRATVRVRVER
jgi:hypothetical protein